MDIFDIPYQIALNDLYTLPQFQWFHTILAFQQIQFLNKSWEDLNHFNSIDIPIFFISIWIGH